MSKTPPPPKVEDARDKMVPAALALGEAFAAHLRIFEFYIDAKAVDDIVARLREEKQC